MSTHLTPEGFRTAAYLEARARLDARRKTKNVRCNPPNVKCGKRCIPPSWDCRLKNQGTDSHLSAVKTDPLGGFANIERGTKRIVKGIAKGSPSDIHGGKQAIIRGTVKIAPGNIEQKKQLRAKLEQRTYAIGIGLLVVGGGFGLHNILMKANTFGYRNGVGRNINESMRSGVNQVLDAIPVLGAQRRRTRAAVSAANAEAAYRAAFNRVTGPETLTQTLGSGGERAIPRTPLTSTLLDGHGNLRKAVDKVNSSFAGNVDVYAWDKQHREAFWGASLQARDLGASHREISVFARPSAETYLARQFGLENVATTSALKTGIARRLEEERLNLISLAKQRGYRTLGGRSAREYIHTDDFNSFVRDVVGAAGITSTPIRQGLEDHVVSVLRDAPSTYTNNLYRQTVIGYNDFYSSIGSTFTDAPAASFQNRLSESTQSIQQQADLLRASFLARQMNRPPDIAGPSHAELVRRAFFATRVRGNRRTTYVVTNRSAISATRELTGRTDIIGPNEAYRILREQFGFTGIVPPSQGSSGGSRRSPQPPSPNNPWTESNEQRMRRIHSLPPIGGDEWRNSGRGDSAPPELVRTATYLAARADFQEDRRLGKPCGASHIPSTHKCHKGGGVESSSSSTEIKAKPANAPVEAKNNLKAKVAVAATLAVVGSIGVVVALDIRKAKQGSSFASPPSFRTTVRAAQKSGKTKTTGEALEHYYDNLTKNEQWKPGQLVYTRYPKSNEDHYAIYLGKQNGNHVFADYGFDNRTKSKGVVGFNQYGPTGDNKPALIYTMVPAKYGEPVKYSEKELLFRITRTNAQNLKYDVLDNSCETWARMIVNGTPRSVQAERISRISKTVFRQFNDIGDSQAKTLTTMTQVAKILDLEWKAVNGDDEALADVNIFKDLIRRKGKRADSEVAPTFDLLITPTELLPPGITDLEAAVRVKYYLMYVTRLLAALEQPRNDTAGKGKPCGASYIPKNHKCGKDAKTNNNVKTAVKAAAVVAGVAAGAYALKQAKLSQFHTGVGISDIMPPVRKRRFGWMERNQAALTSTDLAKTYDGLKTQKGAIPENVQALQDFITKNNIHSNPASFLDEVETKVKAPGSSSETKKALFELKAQLRLGVCDGLATAWSDNIFVRSTRKNPAGIQADPAEMMQATSRFMDKRAADLSPKRSLSESYRQLHNVSRNTNNGDVNEAITYIHEVAHKAHWKATLNDGQSLLGISNGMIYNPLKRIPFLEQVTGKKMLETEDFGSYFKQQQYLEKLVVDQLKAASSEYGRSDVTGSRVETFAELSVLYMTQGKRFKSEFPMAYAWVDDIWEKARD